MTIARHLLDEPALCKVLALLNADDDEARVVGGAVRNALLDRAITDFDVATTATPDVVTARAQAAGIRAIPTGIAHGTVTLRVDSRAFEVTTLRDDIETDGRHAQVRFGRDFARDAMRRDFTINALSMSSDGKIHDYTNGVADIAAGRVRFIGDPTTRIREDYLRILRFFRFSADYATGDLDSEALLACVRERDGLARLSRERVRQELLKLLMGRRAVFAATEMSGSGLLGALFSAVPQPLRLARLLAVDPTAGPTLRLAAITAIVTEDADRLRDRLRLSNAETLRIVKGVTALGHMRGETPPSVGHLRARLFEDGREGALDGLKLAWAESRARPHDTAWHAAARFLHDTPEPRLPFSAEDLVARGIATGKPLGLALKRLQTNWIRAGFPQDPRDLASLLDEIIRGP